MEAFGFAAQLISTISVIVSLIYLAFQIRENTRSMRRAASHDLLRGLDELGRMFIEIPDLSELFFTALEQPQELTAAEHFRFVRLMTYMFSRFETAVNYHGEGLLDDEVIETYGQGVLQLFDSPTVVAWWEKEGQFTFSQSFRDMVSDRIAA